MATSLAIPLLTNDSATGASVTLASGGRYIWTTAGTFGGATLSLDGLGPDGATWQSAATTGAGGQLTVFCGQGESVRVSVSGGSPSGLYSSLVRAN